MWLEWTRTGKAAGSHPTARYDMEHPLTSQLSCSLISLDLSLSQVFKFEKGKTRVGDSHGESNSIKPTIWGDPQSLSVAGWLSVDKILEGCSGKKEKTHCVMKPSCDWFSAVDSIQKFAVVKRLVRRKNPQDVEGLTLYLGQIITLYLGLCR